MSVINDLFSGLGDITDNYVDYIRAKNGYQDYPEYAGRTLPEDPQTPASAEAIRQAQWVQGMSNGQVMILGGVVGVLVLALVLRK